MKSNKNSKASKPAKKAEPHALALKIRDLNFIFEVLQNLLSVHAPPFTLCVERSRGKRGVHLVVPSPVVIAGAYGGQPVRLSLADVLVQKKFIGFYFMPIYLKPELKKKLAPVLLRLLKGKTCFHIKSIAPELEEALRSALRVGIKSYKDRGWG